MCYFGLINQRIESGAMNQLILSKRYFLSVRHCLMAICLAALPFNAAADGPTANVLDLEMTQSQFCQLSAREISSLSRNDRYWENFTVDGFSSFFGRSSLLDLMQAQRGRTCRVIRDMSRLTTTTSRRARLDQEIQWALDLRANLLRSLERLEGRQQTAATRLAVRSENEQLRKTDDYIKGLRSWRRNLREGSR